MLWEGMITDIVLFMCKGQNKKKMTLLDEMYV